jgi:hypothetical protein
LNCPEAAALVMGSPFAGSGDDRTACFAWEPC